MTLDEAIKRTIKTIYGVPKPDLTDADISQWEDGLSSILDIGPAQTNDFRRNFAGAVLAMIEALIKLGSKGCEFLGLCA